LAHYQSADSIEIRTTPGKIYEALTDWEKRMAWRKGLTLRYEGSDQAVVGQKISASLTGFPSHSFEFKITGLEPPYRIFMEYTGKPLKGRASIEILPDQGFCHVSFYWLRVEPVGFLAQLYFRLGGGLANHRRRTQQTLQMLKAHLEK
jgi:uncharacterized protein YndB with AHSA1/START domain